MVNRPRKSVLKAAQRLQGTMYCSARRTSRSGIDVGNRLKDYSWS